MSDTVFIYAVVCPLAQEPCYVGQTVNPDERLRAHASPHGASNKEMRKWARKVQSAGAEPTMRILETCGADRADDREDYWIKKMITDGHSLMNKNFRGQTWHSFKKWKPRQ